MIIARSPLRISLGGGGTDLPSYYQHHGGFVIAAAINQYVCITVNRRFVPRILLKYARMEGAEDLREVRFGFDFEGTKVISS
jgi:D-glycero-alpha-D-manno-heptose-7-phosphate kinase